MKLVRDNIPTIMKKAGKNPKIKIACEEEYWKALKDKLKEEVNEFLENPTEEELVDIYEVMHAIYDLKKIDKEILKKIRAEKAKTHGQFKKRIILE